jgi:alpha-methylacyl-CoA racemase
MTGWGQDGPYAQAAGHDINYISLSGVLGAIGSAGGPPVVPLNLVGDFGGGGMLLAFGVVCGILEAQRSGQGQVVDASMVDGSALLMAMMYGFRARGEWELERGVNIFDGGAPFYGVYECADGRYLSVGALEPQFFAALVEGLGADRELLQRQHDHDAWPADRRHFAEIIATRTRDEWVEHFAGVDACVSPVLDMDEASTHPHNVARGTFHVSEGAVHPSPAPRFSRTGPTVGQPYDPGGATLDVLSEVGYEEHEIAELVAAKAVGQAHLED